MKHVNLKAARLGFPPTGRAKREGANRPGYAPFLPSTLSRSIWHRLRLWRLAFTNTNPQAAEKVSEGSFRSTATLGCVPLSSAAKNCTAKGGRATPRKLPGTTGHFAVESESRRCGGPGRHSAVPGERMIRIRQIAALGVSLVALAVVRGTPGRGRWRAQGAIITGNPAPSPEQIQSLITRAIENQHRDDRALEEFERIEHVRSRARPKTPRSSPTSRSASCLPATGNIKLKMAENGVPVSPEIYRRNWSSRSTRSNSPCIPNDRYKEDLAKFEKRRHDHAELVDTAQKPFA